MGNSDGVWRTTDAGANWELIGAGISSPDKILVDPLNERTLCKTQYSNC